MPLEGLSVPLLLALAERLPATNDCALMFLKRVQAAWSGARVGVLLRAPGAGDHEPASVQAWANRAKSLVSEGARILGGGAGTTVAHLAALATALRGGHEEQR